MIVIVCPGLLGIALKLKSLLKILRNKPLLLRKEIEKQERRAKTSLLLTGLLFLATGGVCFVASCLEPEWVIWMCVGLAFCGGGVTSLYWRAHYRSPLRRYIEKSPSDDVQSADEESPVGQDKCPHPEGNGRDIAEDV